MYCRICDNPALATDYICSRCGIELAEAQADFERTESYGASSQVQTIPGIEPFSGVASILGPTIGLFSKNLWFITKLVFVLFAPLEIVRVFKFGGPLVTWEDMLGVQLLRFFCNVLIAPALTYGLFMTLKTGTNPGLRECCRWGISKLPIYLISSIIVGILTVLGFICLIVPGIIVFLTFLPITPVATLENHGILETLKRSLYLSHGRRISIFLAVLCLILLGFLVKIPFDFLPTMSGMQNWPLLILVELVGDILDQSTTVLALVIYVSIVQTWRRVDTNR